MCIYIYIYTINSDLKQLDRTKSRNWMDKARERSKHCESECHSVVSVSLRPHGL